MKHKDSEEFADIMLSAKEVVVDGGESAPQKSLVIVRADATARPESPALSDAAATALGLLAEIGTPRVSKREWKAMVDAEYRRKVADKTFMNWVKELVDAGEVKRVKRGSYELKDYGSASASEVPLGAIGKAA